MAAGSLGLYEKQSDVESKKFLPGLHQYVNKWLCGLCVEVAIIVHLCAFQVIL